MKAALRSAHQEVGQGGHFLGAVHTLERFRECFYRPLVSSTENYERWNRNGGRDTATRANDIWKKTLEEYEEPQKYLDASVAYKVSRYAELFVNGTNLTNEYQRYYLVWPDQAGHNNYSERMLTLGMRGQW